MYRIDRVGRKLGGSSLVMYGLSKVGHYSISNFLRKYSGYNRLKSLSDEKKAFLAFGALVAISTLFTTLTFMDFYKR